MPMVCRHHGMGWALISDDGIKVKSDKILILRLEPNSHEPVQCTVVFFVLVFGTGDHRVILSKGGGNLFVRLG
jgi:hypothetical protein